MNPHDLPPDSEIREFAAYYIRAIKIFREEFRDSVGREPSEFELTDFSKMGIIPFGFVPKQNGFQKQSQDHTSTSQNSSVNKENTNPPAQTKDQPARQNAGPVESVMDIVKAHPELEIDGSRVIIKKKIESKKDYFDIKDELTKRGWKYVAPKHIGGEKWEPGYFEIEAKA